LLARFPRVASDDRVGCGPGAGGQVDFEAWILFAILFLWQMPHFLASPGFIAKIIETLDL